MALSRGTRLGPYEITAQIGVGGRFAWVTADSDADVDSVRFIGGHVRRIGLDGQHLTVAVHAKGNVAFARDQT